MRVGRRELMEWIAAVSLGGCGQRSTDPTVKPPSASPGTSASAIASSKSADAPPTETDVIVIGAGVAGLSAAHDLAAGGRKVVVLEARDRIGGRLWTNRSWKGMNLDMGASWIHGAKGNPVTDIAKQLSLETKMTTWENVKLYESESGALPASETEHAAKVLKRVVRAGDDAEPGANATVREVADRAARDLELSEHDRLDLEFELTAEVEQDFACDASDLAWSGLEEGKGDRGDDFLFPGGYDGILGAFTPGLDVRLGHVVSRIVHDDAGVRVETSRGNFHAQRALVTLPLGVLKSGNVRFDPPLAGEKAHAVDAMAMGVLDKIYLRFPEIFWPNDAEIFGRVAKGGDFITWINIAYYTKAPVLMAFHAGSAALRIEAMTDDEIVAHAVDHLKAMFGADVKSPEAVLVTRWAQDPFALGSYSHIAKGSTPKDRAALAEPIGDRLFFAGEATERDYPATIRGALESGRREAKRISKL
jgi:monoamine oxidase